MLSRIALSAALIAAALPAAAQTAPMPIKLFSSAADVERMIAKARANHRKGNTVETIGWDGTYRVQFEYRTGTTPPSLHKGQSELIYVIAGGCTLVTGGTLVDAKTNGANMSGTAIKGGTPRKITKGDYVLVPTDTPHWYTDVQGEFISATLHMPVAAK
jgi:mannose-6-phosphate isomerase-like protein (cupin superfamily)